MLARLLRLTTSSVALVLLLFLTPALLHPTRPSTAPHPGLTYTILRTVRVLSPSLVDAQVHTDLSFWTMGHCLDDIVSDLQK